MKVIYDEGDQSLDIRTKEHTRWEAVKYIRIVDAGIALRVFFQEAIPVIIEEV